MNRNSQAIWTEWQSLSNYLEKKKPSSLFVLMDENTARHCWPICLRKNPLFEKAELLEIPAGEDSKNIAFVHQLWQALVELKADRDSLLVNLGGGVVTDLGGFVASTYMRGIDFVNIPTSLLGMVDASIGGKTGINLEQGKNLVGTIELPKGVLIDADFLDSLPFPEVLSGFAEMIKHSLIAGENHWSKLKTCNISSTQEIKGLIQKSAAIKRSVVESDLKESGARKKLNLGHSYGHAVEAIARKKGNELRHGEAIAIGIVAEAKLSVKMGLLREKLMMEIEDFIHAQYPELRSPQCSFSELLEFLEHDKKNRGNEIRFSLLEDLGKVSLDQKSDLESLEEVWEYTKKSFNG